MNSILYSIVYPRSVQLNAKCYGYRESVENIEILFACGYSVFDPSGQDSMILDAHGGSLAQSSCTLQ